MAYKYVAFGQLIDGESTLKKIESVPTFYESPISKVIMERTGVLNLEYQDIRISKHVNEYLQGHIEDLVALGDIFYAVSIFTVLVFLLFPYFNLMLIFVTHLSGIDRKSI